MLKDVDKIHTAKRMSTMSSRSILSDILERLTNEDPKSFRFRRDILSEMDDQKASQPPGRRAWIEFPYDGKVFVCAAILKAILHDSGHTVDLGVDQNNECTMIVTW